MFISFEGLEGSGKSTQVGLLASKLKENGHQIVVTREPGGTRIGELIRNITHGKENVDLTAVAEAYLMAASRAQHVREIIRPALEKGKIVICDRFIDSSLAYQGYGRELGFSTIEQLNHLAISGKNAQRSKDTSEVAGGLLRGGEISKADVCFPDLTIFLDISPEVGISRRNGTGKIDRLDLQQKDFYRRVYEGYKKLAEKYKERYFTVDGAKSTEEIAKEIWQTVSPNLPNLPNSP
jgi:dTMP kinase